ncbi:MAG: site-specific integrase [Candidatus Riflebacteria bacterium]|nr:site-specific integrase [Candidatus Riflebacteria bacterium]
MSSLINHKGFWHIQYSLDGHKHHKSTGIKINNDPRKTLAKVAQRDFDIHQTWVGLKLDEDVVTVAQAINQFIDSRALTSPVWYRLTRTMGKMWIAFFKTRGVETLDKIQPRHLEEYIVSRKEVVALKTIKNDLGVLTGAIRLANERLCSTPIKMTGWPKIGRTPSKRPNTIGAYTSGEVRLLLEYLKHKRRIRWYFPCLVLVYTGCRYGEMANLTCGDVRVISPSTIRIESRKTAKTSHDQIRVLEMHTRLAQELEPLLIGKNPGDILFPGILTRAVGLDKVIRRACKKLKIQYRRVHGFRHYWVTELGRAGVPLPVVQQWAGHSDIKTTMRYCSIDGSGAAGYISVLK